MSHPKNATFGGPKRRMKIRISVCSAFQVAFCLSAIAFAQCAGVTTASSNISSTCPFLSPFVCNDGLSCTSRLQFCNGALECSDGSDEILYNAAIHANMEGAICRRVVDSRPHACYIPKRMMCDHEIDCTFGSDECNCPHTFKCATLFGRQQWQMCRVRVQFCDNVNDCWDNSDEWKYKDGVPGFQCSVTKTHMRNYCMLPTVNVCDGISDCDDGTDECFCTNPRGTYDGSVVLNNTFSSNYLNDRCFRCLDSSLVVPAKKLCDGVFHCKDLSDECLCSQQRPNICEQVCQVGFDCGNCSAGQVMCSTNSSQAGETICIDRSKVCDQNFDCPNREDEVDCAVDKDLIFNCADGSKYIPKYMHCDNRTDCPDGSDEVLCETMYRCNSPRPVHKKTVNYREYAWSFESPAYVTSCDGIPECEDLDDECNTTRCPNVPNDGYCRYVRGTSGFVFSHVCNVFGIVWLEASRNIEPPCVNSMSRVRRCCPNSRSALLGKEICDGFPTCNDTAPHESADEWDCINRFYCADHGRSQLPIHIPLSARCNDITDCFDVSDEIGCNDSTHYYCKSGTPLYIPKSKVCNGIQECQDGEDECQNCATSPYSSDKFLISSYVLQVVVWITGILAMVGNVAVLIHNGLQISGSSDTRSPVSYINRILVLNLALADFLFGVYLVSLGIVNSVYGDIYCRKDIQWRGSYACIGLGCLAMISVETSVFILAIMTSYRYYTFTMRFETKLKTWMVVVVILAAWCLSFVLAFVPLSAASMDYFVSSTWYRNNPFLANPTRSDVENFVIRLQTFEDQSKQTFSNGVVGPFQWTSMIAIIEKLRRGFVPEFNLGYYSAHGVCLPRLFSDPANDRAWGYSLFIIIVNFISLVYMAVAHLFIYRTSARRAKETRNGSERMSYTLQHTISRIVITGLCWFTICVMAFISASGTTLSVETYCAAAIVLLPINSAANPFLYSDLPELMWKKMKPLRQSVNSLVGARPEDQTDGTVFIVSASIQLDNSPGIQSQSKIDAKL